ncbi:putative reverse transcriptase domain-containing protein [Tanacetum coccineum]
MAPKRTTRATPATKTTTKTFITNAQLKALIDHGVVAALATRDVDRSMNGDDSHNSGTSTEGVVELTQWFKRMEIVFSISNCTMENQIKFVTCTLLGIALTLCNSHVNVEYAMTWIDLKKKMTNNYCPRGEIKKLEVELWNLKVKGTDVISYNQRFQELALMCVRMFLEESDKIKKYVGGLPDMIHDSVMASKPKTMQDAIEMATELMDKKIITLAERQTENKRNPANANTANNQRGTGAGQKPTCYEYGVQGHFKRECPKLKNNNRGNPVRSGNAPAKVYAVGNAGTNPNSNVVMGTFLLNNRYASILFDTGADRSFMSTVFNFQIDITPTTLEHFYDFRRYNQHGLVGKLPCVIVCDEKIVRVLFGNDTLIICGDGSNQGSETYLNIILCTKTQKYLLKGCLIFLAHVTTKDTEDKSKEKRLEDVPIVLDFPEIFPEDLPGIPPP